MNAYQQHQQQQLLQAYYSQFQQQGTAGAVGADGQLPAKYKSTLCNIWLMEGTCARGKQCHYAHGIKELNYRQDDTMGRYYKTSLCNFYQQRGFCNNGDQCRWAHGEAELRKMTTDGSSNGFANYYATSMQAMADGQDNNGSSVEAAAAAAAAAAASASVTSQQNNSTRRDSQVIGPQLDALLSQQTTAADSAEIGDDEGGARKRIREAAGI
uniref:C3H1-type domain-containing protein n=1 Tax=Globodera rostochiensis TaxID=31243 RepID=A0A914GS11_GLORO